jgi:hypothetical protein
MTNGVRAADGLVTITFTPAAPVIVAPRFTG